MPNECQIIITKGQNTGKKCFEVNRWCKHYKTTCKRCGKQFMYRHSYESHRCTQNKIRVSVKKKQNPDQSEIFRLISQLQKEVQELKQQPRVLIDNLTVITDDIFSKMSSEMGTENAIKFLMEALRSDTECLDIVDRVYLNAPDPNQYPIACKDLDHFRFLGPNSDIVDDIGGKIIVSKLTESVQNAMIQASSQLMQRCDDPDILLDNLNILTLQEKLTTLPSEDNQARFKRELAIKVLNPSHPFFMNTNN